MKATIDIYLGAPIEPESERCFLRQLCSDLRARGETAIIFANRLLPARKPLHHVDFLVLLSHCACHVELEHFTCPVVGKSNGPWSLQPDGSLKTLDAKNPYRQAPDCRMAISDQMHAFAAECRTSGLGLDHPVSPAGLSSAETTGPPKFLGDPHTCLHMFSAPGRSAHL